MDLALDYERAARLDCGTCDRGLQKLRNCSGQGSPAKVELNGKFYPRCPRAIALESFEGRYLVGLYFECRETNMYPFPGGYSNQTAYFGEVLNFLDTEVGQHKLKQARQQRAEAERKNAKRS